MQPGRKKTFIWLFVSLAVAALLLAIALRPTGVEEWEAMANRIDQLKIETRSRKLSRSVFEGESVPGKAWDEYNIALRDAQAWDDDQNGSLFLRFVNGDPKVDRTKVEHLVASHAKAIEHLRLGAQRSDGQYPYNWERGSQMELPSLMGSRRMANAAVAQARILAEKGRPQDAADLLLDVTVFARDLSTNAPLLSNLIGFAVYSTAFDEFRNLVLSGKLTQKQFADLARKLEAVDRDFPTFSSTVSVETLHTNQALVDTAGEEPWVRFKGAGLGFALNPRTMVTRAVEERDGYIERSRNFDRMNFAAAKKEADAISSEVEASPNALVRYTVPNLYKTLLTHRNTLAHLRLLRAGTGFLATGEMPTLADPFGSKLLFKREGGKSKIWSVGSNGTNQNGVGNWEGKPDILLEIQK